jgi:hypothetical protein
MILNSLNKLLINVFFTLSIFSTSAFALDSDHFVIKVATTADNETFNFYTEDSITTLTGMAIKHLMI